MLFIVRHGETDFNQQGIAQGHLQDPILTDKGKRQIANVAQYLAKQKLSFDNVLTSDLKRAIESWKIIEPFIDYKEYTIDPKLREKFQGQLEGEKYESQDWKIYQKALDRADMDFPMFEPQPESPLDFRHRVVAAIEDINLEEHTLIVTHGGFMRNYLAHLKGIELDEYLKRWREKLRIGNGNIIIVYSKADSKEINVLSQKEMI